LGRQGASNLIGTIEVITAILIALRTPFPKLSAAGSLMASFALVGTLSFLFTTPGIDPKTTTAGFLFKDLVLLGAALWTTSEALLGARQRDNLL
jgi:reactive chlorine resistance protein C